MLTKVELYQVDARGNARVWSIETEDNRIIISHGLMGGQIQRKVEHVPFGKGGRTIAQQIKSRYESRISKQIDKGYKRSVEQAREGKGTNSLNYYKPMLAKPFADVRRVVYDGAFVQPKLDGHRCLITRVNGETIAYSRQSKLISSVGHITKSLSLEEGETIDGELYCHGESLQRITSWVKRKQEDTLRLKYHAYDMVDERPFAERFSALGRAIGASEFALQTSTEAARSYEFVRSRFLEYRRNGYEGAIIRWGNEGYQAGKRSKYLVKVKGKIDDEFKVLDIIPSVDGWGILVCEARNGRAFKVNAPGSITDKHYAIIHKSKYIGMLITVEYANLTADGIPFHPVALRWREDV